MTKLSPLERQELFNEKLIEFGSHKYDENFRLIPNPNMGYDEARMVMEKAEKIVKDAMNPKIRKQK